jgi:hypothetical protein
VPDPRVLSIPEGTAPGWYRLEVGLYRSADGVRLPVVQEGGASATDFVALDYVFVGALEELVPSQPVVASLGDEVSLLGHDGLPHSVGPGEDIPLTLYWRALSDVPRDYTVFVHLLDERGQVVSQHDGQPMQGFYPTSRWDVDRTVRDEVKLPVGHSVPPGEYRLVAGMYVQSTGERLPVVGAEGQVLGDTVNLGEVVVTGE